MSRFRLRTGSPGFSLIEVAIVLVIIGIVLGMGFNAATRFAEAEAHDSTMTRLLAIEEALIRFVALNKRLPCPTNASLDESSTRFGLEEVDGSDSRLCATGSSISGVPWRTLGLPIEISYDGWRRRISYVVFDGQAALADDGITGGPGLGATDEQDLSLVRSGGLEMGDCEFTALPDTHGTLPPQYRAINDCADSDWGGPPHNVLNFLSHRGLTLRTGATTTVLSPVILGIDETDAHAGPPAGGGAAFVLISHGLNGLGAYTRAGGREPLPDTGLSLEYENVDGDTIYMDAPTSSSAEEDSYFDDIVIAPSIFELLDRADLSFSGS